MSEVQDLGGPVRARLLCASSFMLRQLAGLSVRAALRVPPMVRHPGARTPELAHASVCAATAARAALGASVCAASAAAALCCQPSLVELQAAGGEISTHVISKLGKDSVDGARVRVYYHSSFEAGPLSPGWSLVKEGVLSANGAIDDLVEPGELKKGLYMIEFDFEGVNHAARQLYRRVDGAGNDHNSYGGANYVALNPAGFFLAARSTLTLKIEDENSLNHLVLSVGDKVRAAPCPAVSELPADARRCFRCSRQELTARPGVRAH